MLNVIVAAVLVPPALVAVTLMVDEAARVGVPVIAPVVVLKLNPPGNTPV
jgi:hypothetical protein